MPRYEVVSTPNPDSLKFTADGFRFIDSGMVSAGTAEEATGNALVERLCEMESISNVFVLPQFMTVTKHPGASWDDLLPAIEELLDESFYG